MNLIQAIILGLVQGLTEFLPVSSSGHLVLFEKFLGLGASNLRFEVALHLATLLAVCFAFRRRIGKLIKAVFTGRIRRVKGKWQFSDDNLRLALLLILATIPAAVIGILFDDFIEQAFNSPITVSLALLLTGAILFGTGKVAKRQEKITWKHSLIIGFSQALAILPGISRSGATISAGIYSPFGIQGCAEDRPAAGRADGDHIGRAGGGGVGLPGNQYSPENNPKFQVAIFCLLLLGGGVDLAGMAVVKIT